MTGEPSGPTADRKCISGSHATSGEGVTATLTGPQGKGTDMRKPFLALVVFFVSVATGWSQMSIRPAALGGRFAAVSTTGSILPSMATLTVPADTEAAIEMLSGVHTQVSHVDDPIQARLTKPVYVNGRLALPSGTLVEGRITRLQPAGRMHRPAELTFRFDQISLPDGQTAPISAFLSPSSKTHLRGVRFDNEGNLKGTRRFSWRGITGGLVAAGSAASIKAALAGAGALAYALPVGGAALIGYELLVPRGHEIHVPPETQFNLHLNAPVTVRVRS